MFVNNLVVETIKSDTIGNVYYLTGEYSGDVARYAAYHFDQRTGELWLIMAGLDLDDGLKSIRLYREGIRT